MSPNPTIENMRNAYILLFLLYAEALQAGSSPSDPVVGVSTVHIAALQPTSCLRQVDLDGTFACFDEVEGALSLAAIYRLSAVCSNPARSAARLDLAVREAQTVRVEAYNLMGQCTRPCDCAHPFR